MGIGVYGYVRYKTTNINFRKDNDWQKARSSSNSVCTGYISDGMTTKQYGGDWMEKAGRRRVPGNASSSFRRIPPPKRSQVRSTETFMYSGTRLSAGEEEARRWDVSVPTHRTAASVPAHLAKTCCFCEQGLARGRADRPASAPAVHTFFYAVGTWCLSQVYYHKECSCMK